MFGLLKKMLWLLNTIVSASNHMPLIIIISYNQNATRQPIKNV